MKIKDTKIGAYLKDKAPNVLNIVGDLLPDSGALGIIKNIIDATVPDPKDKALILSDIEGMESEYLKDVQNARDNETARDTDPNAGFLSKNIHEIIALAVVGSWIVSWYCRTIIQPEEITGVVTLILGYLYGRTKPQ